MKKIIIFEDSLENTVAYVGRLAAMEVVSDINILLYCVNTTKAEEKIQELSDKFSEKVKIEKVTLWDYEERLDYFYAQENTLFLFDMNLNGDGSTMFSNRINVMYAKKKKQAGKKVADLENLKVQRIDHYLSTEELIAEFGENGWK